MNNVSLFYKLSWKFCARYFKEFFIEYLKPSLLFLLSMFILGLGTKIPVYVYIVLSLLVVLPLSCYALWKMTVICFALIPACYEFLKNGAKKSFKDIVNEVNQKKLISFFGFCLVIYLIIMILIPLMVFALKDNIAVFFIFIISIFVLIMPFSFLSLQAFYFKKDNENYLDLLKNCYTKLDINIILIIISLIIINGILSVVPLVNIIISFFMPVIIIPVCTFWYYTKVTKKN